MKLDKFFESLDDLGDVGDFEAPEPRKLNIWNESDSVNVNTTEPQMN